MNNKMVISLFFCFGYTVCFNDVHTSSGTVRGLTVRVLNTNVDQYLGIPYAKPPIGDLRFARPEPINNASKEIIDGTQEGISCMQYPGVSSKVSEDCLVLNIWTTNRANTKTLQPVMFFIHGGGLTGGSIYELNKVKRMAYNGSALATNGVVFVAANYRLSSFGLMYGGVDSAPGNLPLYDQQLALKWVHENIHLFGGDNKLITIFGQSAGSMSVSAHILSPLSRGLFRRAVMESGAHMHYTKRQRWTPAEGIEFGQRLATRLNCSGDWLECLRWAPAETLYNLTIADRAMERLYLIEGTENLPHSVQEVFTNRSFISDIDLMAGVCRDETGGVSDGMSVDDFKGMANYFNGLMYGLDVDKLVNFYLNNVNVSEPLDVEAAFYRFISDATMICPTYLFTKAYTLLSRPNNHVYFYELSYKSQYYSYGNYTDVIHGSELPFVVGQPLMTPGYHIKKDLKFSKEVMTMWTHFVKYGFQNTLLWPELMNKDKSFRVKDLNPDIIMSSKGLINPYKANCDQFWQGYFMADVIKQD